MDGVREEAARFEVGFSPFAGAGRFRRLAGSGPIYEVLEEHGERLTARRVDEEATFYVPRADAMLDPLA